VGEKYGKYKENISTVSYGLEVPMKFRTDIALPIIKKPILMIIIILDIK